jgi:hypothetical protein
MEPSLRAVRNGRGATEGSALASVIRRSGLCSAGHFRTWISKGGCRRGDPPGRSEPLRSGSRRPRLARPLHTAGTKTSLSSSEPRAVRRLCGRSTAPVRPRAPREHPATRKHQTRSLRRMSSRGFAGQRAHKLGHVPRCADAQGDRPTLFTMSEPGFSLCYRTGNADGCFACACGHRDRAATLPELTEKLRIHLAGCKGGRGNRTVTIDGERRAAAFVEGNIVTEGLRPAPAYKRERRIKTAPLRG